MKLLYVVAISAVLTTACTSQVSGETPTPGVTTKAYDVAEFDRLRVSSGIEVDFETGKSQSVVAENKNGAWDKLIIQVEEDTLNIKRPDRAWNWNEKKEKFKVTVSAPRIEAVRTSSGSNVTGTGVSGDAVVIESSSGSTARITDIDASSLTVDTSSGSDVTLSGTCSNLTVDTSSGSSLDADELVCQYATADSSSGSSATFAATQSVIADASSGASVKVYGNPLNSEIDKSSGGSVSIRD